MSNERFLTVEQIRAKFDDLGRVTLHGPPPDDWFMRWMDDVDVLLGALNIADFARAKVEADNTRLRAVLDAIASYVNANKALEDEKT